MKFAARVWSVVLSFRNRFLIPVPIADGKFKTTFEAALKTFQTDFNKYGLNATIPDELLAVEWRFEELMGKRNAAIYGLNYLLNECKITQKAGSVPKFTHHFSYKVCVCVSYIIKHLYLLMYQADVFVCTRCNKVAPRQNQDKLMCICCGDSVCGGGKGFIGPQPSYVMPVFSRAGQE